ncbi:MAG: SurA N-terminal domain-containing protein [Bacteriovoracia bacterium]
MLKFMRAHMGQKVLLIIVGAIALTFVFFGVFPEARNGAVMGASEVASVNGEKITYQDFQQAVARDVENYRNLGMELPPELMENIKFSTLQGLVKNKLMLVEARRLGITASDREVSDEIQRMPYFQDKDKKAFDVELYKRVLSSNNLSPGQFEQNVREGLINQRMMKFIEARIRVTPVEVAREYQLANEQRNLSFVRFAREDAYKKMKVDAKELDAFLADKDKSLQVNTFYTQNNSRYNKPESVCARHILQRDENRESKEAPKSFLKLNPTAANFAALAEKNSQDPGTKAKGGDLGCFQKGQMDKAFEETAFSSPVGKVSAPVRSSFGWHYILVYKKEAPVHKPIETVRREIAEEILKKQRIDEVRKINLAAGEEAVKHWPPAGEKVQSTGLFNSLEGSIPQIGRADEIIKAAFDPEAKIQKGPQLFESAGGVIVAVVKERKSAEMGKLKQNEAQQESSLRERKLRAFMPAWMEDVQKRVKISYNKKLLEQM